MPEQEEFGVAEAIDYWDARHRARDVLRSGGDLSFDFAGNELFYALRIGRLIDVLGVESSVVAPKRILDAGCGKGIFSRAVASFGHRVDGIDSSEHAIDLCRGQAGDRESYQVSTLDAWAPGYCYDVVYSIDVLFHIMPDEVWRASVANLADLVTFGGLLALVDYESDADHVWGAYQKTRAGWRYDELLTGRGMRRDGFVPYRFRSNPGGFHVFTKVG